MSENRKGRRLISRNGKGDVLKNKDCTIMQISFLHKGESSLIALFLVQDLLSSVNLGSVEGSVELYLHLLGFDYFQLEIIFMPK